MKKKVIKFKFDEEEDYENLTIFSIYSHLPDYRVALLLNKAFNINLEKKYKNFDNKEIPFFNFKNNPYSYTFIKNIIPLEREKSLNLFSEVGINNYTHIYIKRKEVDYFFSYDGGDAEKILKTIKNIKEIFDVSYLKKKEYINIDELI